MTAQARSIVGVLGWERLSREVVVCWNKRMRSSAGRAWLRQSRIDLNPRLLQLAEGEAEVRRTLLHELAHLVAHERCGGRKIAAHGPEWRQACAELGIPGEPRCHALELPVRRLKRRYAYTCGQCGAVVKRVRRLRRPVACGSCCAQNAGGRYDVRYRLRESLLE